MIKKLIVLISAFSICSCINNINVNQEPKPTITNKPESPSPIIYKGFLEGKLSISPLCPVEPCQISNENKKLSYEARKIQIFKRNSTDLYIETIADYMTEKYKVELPIGDYTLKVTNGNLNNFIPIDFNIKENNTTTLDLNIDTGIR
ncbi:MAG: hypothetical protein U0354_01465 [Candidatus Sericytochromatia bacterium]